MAEPYQDLSPEDAHLVIQEQSELQILDVRTEPEYQSYRLQGSKLIPVQELQQRVEELDPNLAYLVHCEHGMRSVAACEFLASLGFKDLRNLSGGMAQWAASGLPMEQG